MTPPDLAPALRLERPLPRTPFGDAWAAHADDAVVTVVVLAPELVALAADRARLVAALRARAGVREPHEVFAPLLDVVVAPGDDADAAIAVVFALEEREPVGARLARSRTVATSDVAEAARAIGAALDASHAAGLRHGALAPGMLYVADGRPARVLGHGLVEVLVEAGAPRDLVLDALGARHYAAPELVSDTTPTPAADIYALGATLYACLTGRPPFGGRTTAMIMANVLADEALTGEVPRIAPVSADARAQAAAAERLTQALLRAVERAPEDRWPTAGELVRALDPRAATPRPILVEPPSNGARFRAAAGATVRRLLQHGFLARLLSRQELR
jgi:hypothetical protein